MKRAAIRLFFAFTVTTVLTSEPATVKGAEDQLAGAAGQVRMEAARNDVANVRSNIFLTLVELDRVRGERDPQRPQFQVFTNHLAQMKVLAKAFAKRAEEMKQKGSAYFATWEARTAAIQNPEAHQRAMMHYDERKKAYDAINSFMQDARANFIQYVDYLDQIQATLERGTDPESVATAKELFQKANWRCLDVQRALMNMEDQFELLAASFARDQPPK
jgi:hypothetical protein